MKFLKQSDHPLGQLRLVGTIEAITLLTLLCVSVPVKHMFDWPYGSLAMGPIHGVALILYMVTLIENASAGFLKRGEIVKSFIVCFIPFGPFFNDKMIKRKMKEEDLL